MNIQANIMNREWVGFGHMFAAVSFVGCITAAQL